MRGNRLRPSPGRAAVWLLIGLICAAIAALPAAAAGKPASPGKSAAAHQKVKKTHTANSHAFKNTGPGTWGPNGHQPSENSFPQGYSPSDPDGATNGGADKPGQDGGYNADKDGNNGCGNDTDREDDNNGWCGKKPAPTVAPSVAPTETESPPAGVRPSGQVLGEIVQGAPEVLGVQLSRTGAPVLIVFGTGLLMLITGLVMRRPRRATRETQ